MNIIGHQKIIKLLDKTIARDVVSHAYLFYGPEKVGKFTVAVDFAKKLVVDGDKISPDIIIVQPEIEDKKGSLKKHLPRRIKIEQIRELQHQLSLTAQSGNQKVAIIKKADRLNKSAQNALLKTLEEANPGVIIILVAHDMQRLLPTILSRCQKIKFGTVKDFELDKESTIKDEQKKKELIFWSFGRPGLMLDLSGDEAEISFREDSMKELENIFSQNVSDKFALAEEMSKDQDILTKKLEIWLLIFREAILGRKIFSRKDQTKILELLEKTGKSLETIKETNSSAKIVLENLFLNF
jgi:DNA polymerase III subunit delta'